ncbi:MAG: hypothetical protein GX166_02570 [Clostridiaceae bacterium]|jgi:hypothetical protein|nr:hypothetical protein [Clostridiaceae bacterium]
MYFADNLKDDLLDHIGETITIFTKSGGESGRGFTGVLLSVNGCLVRLTTRIGPAPGCALGNACDYCFNSRRSRGDYRGFQRDIGSVIDIPIDSIAAVVFNAV